jgi:hypothetical protein
MKITDHVCAICRRSFPTPSERVTHENVCREETKTLRTCAICSYVVGHAATCENNPLNVLRGVPGVSASGIKLDTGKLQMGLISKIFLWGLARVLTFGASKYAAHNWRKGIEYSRLFDALQRHLWAWWGGEELDPESGECHLDHAACCLMFLRELRDTRLDLDNRYMLPAIAVQKPNEPNLPT